MGHKIIKNFDDFRAVKAIGQVREPTGEPYYYRTVYRYTEEQIAPLFQFVQTRLSAKSDKAAELIAKTKRFSPLYPPGEGHYAVSPELWELLTGEKS